MFAVVFEVNPYAEQGHRYLDLAKTLRPELEQIDGFVDNIRYRSLTRDGWILSLSSWRDEKALVRWRTRARHHGVQVEGRETVLADYRLRVGQITQDTHVPEGYFLTEQRLDETEVGDGTTVTLIDGVTDSVVPDQTAAATAQSLGLKPNAAGLVGWNVYDAVLNPGELILALDWRDLNAARQGESALRIPGGARSRRIRIVRDYGMFDRHEAPQFYPDAIRHS